MRPRFGNPRDGDLFHVFWGDDPLNSESGSDVWTLRAEGETATAHGGSLAAGAAATYEDVWLREIDWLPTGWSADASDPVLAPIDSIRSFHAWAPGGSAYVQGRWVSAGLVLNAGLRAEYWTAGPQADRQTLPGRGRGVLSFSPRLGIAHPVSVRDVFSFAYVRLSQPPPREALYDGRTLAGNRRPLGNPALVPATVVSYEAAIKHVFTPAWASQLSVFFRDVIGQVGARWARGAGGAGNLRFTNEDEAQAAGAEVSLVHEAGPRARLELHYTWMQAWGNESRSEGDPYGAIREERTTPLTDTPLAWDQRHALHAAGAMALGADGSLSWSSVIGSPLPWTPKPVRREVTDAGLVNSRRLRWSETTNVDVRWSVRRVRGLTVGLEARNLFDHRGDRIATLDGYPNPYINTVYDDYGAYRTLTGRDGGGYLVQPASGPSYWVAVHDARLAVPPRAVRASLALRW